MLKFEIKDTEAPDVNACSLEIHGDLKTILAETVAAINGIFSALGHNDPDDAAVFRAILTQALRDPDSPAWVPAEGTLGGTAIAIKIPKRRNDP